MKITQYFLLALTLFFACEGPKSPVSATVSGKITNPKGDQVSFRWNGETVTDSLNAEGKFNVTLDLSKPQEVRFRHGEESTTLYLRPGDQLSLSLDTKEFDESLKYTGTGEKINNYLAAVVLMGDTIINPRAMYMLPPDSFQLVLGNIKEWKIAALESFNIDDEEFISYAKNDLEWSDRVKKISYEDNYKYLTKATEVELPEDFYAFENEADINDSTQVDYPSFQNFVEKKAEQLAGVKYENRKDQSGGFYSFYLEAIDEIVTIPSIKEKMYYDILNYGYSSLDEERQDYLYNGWLSLNPDAEKVAQIDEQIKQLQKLNPGNPAPAFTYVSIDGDSVSLEDFRGKLVYIDVWATWCGPCIREHPFMEKLQERFEGKDVVFIAVSTDSTQEPWKKMVAAKELGGVHLYAPGAWQSTIIQDYMIKGIPRFILIDREGKIIDANAERPSGSIGDQLDELLQST